MNICPPPGQPRRLRLMSLAVLLLAAINLSHPGRAGGASETAANSKLAGIALPPSAERILDVKTVKESTAPLGTIAAQLDAPMQVQATEVLGWGGANHDRQKGQKIIAEVQAALQKARFEMQKVGEPQTTQGNILSFFVVGSSEQKKALVGYWLESDQLLMLVWGQFGTINAPGAANKAQGKDAERKDVERGAGIATGAPRRDRAAPTMPAMPMMPTFPRLSAKPGQATGVVLNMLGKPLSGARIRFWRLTPQGAIIEYVARTNAQGIYTLDMPPSRDYRLDNATALVSYGEQRYYLPLRPEGDDGSFFDRDAIDITEGYVKNFVLPISGYISAEEDPKEPLSYYGGSLTFRANIKLVIPNDPDPALAAGATGANAVPEGTQIQLTLTPQGPLLDGSTGRSLSWDLQVKNNARINAYSTTLTDIPIGTYTASARVTTPDGNTFTPALTARIVLVNGISSPFTTDSQSPIFFAPRWEDWPMGNGNVDAAVFIKRSSKSGTGSVWLEIGD